MLYQATLTAAELQLLSGIISESLVGIKSDGWGLEIQLDKTMLSVCPQEVATPDAEHQFGSVDRPEVSVIPGSQMTERSPIASGLGKVVSINVLNLLVGFTPPVEVAAIQLLNTTIPAGTGYGYFYFNPELREEVVQRLAPMQAIADWDIALEITTETHPSIVLYTKGYFILVSLNGTTTRGLDQRKSSKEA